MAQLNDSGIYEIINLSTGKIYVGHSKRMSQRWLDHQKDLQKNKHSNCHLQHAWNKYGKDTFIFRKLELVENNKEKLIERELHWCLLKEAHNPNKGYNIEVPGQYKSIKGKQGVNQRKTHFKYTLEYYLNHPKILAKKFTLEERQLIAEKFVELRKEYTQVQIAPSKELNNIYAVVGKGTQCVSIPILIKDEVVKQLPFIQVDSVTGNILNRFTSQAEASTLLGISTNKISDFLERNNFKDRPEKKSRILHPYKDTVIMYEKFYKPDYDYKSAIKLGELVEVVRGDFREVLTKKEFETLIGRTVNDYTWVRLRTVSYREGTVSYLGYTLVFTRKSVVDNPKEPQLKTAEFKERKRTEKFSSKGEIVGLKDGIEVETYSTLSEMSTIIEIPYKACCRLLSNSNGKTGKKKRKGITYVYRNYLKG